jgi:hypothetical protein
MLNQLPLQDPTPITNEEVLAQRKSLHDLVAQNYKKVSEPQPAVEDSK